MRHVNRFKRQLATSDENDPVAPTTETTVLQDVARGDQGAVAEAIDRHGDLVWSLARGLRRSDKDTEHAVQAIFLDLWKAAGRYSPDAGSEPLYVALIARRRLVDMWRRAPRGPAPARRGPEQAPRPAATTDATQLCYEAQWAEQAMNELRLEEQSVLRLGIAEGHSHGEVAAAIGMPLDTATLHMRRGLVRLKELIHGGHTRSSAGRGTADDSATLDLLADRAVVGLDADDARELDTLLAAQPDLDSDIFDLTAAAAHLALVGDAQALPPGLRDWLLIDAREHFRGTVTGARSAPRAALRGLPAPAERRHGLRERAWIGWAFAAGLLVIAAIGWWPAPESWPQPAPSIDELRGDLLASGADTLQLPWVATPDPLAVDVSGDVVWSTERQQGYMTFRDLPANDPGVHQYQLWISDAERPEATPVDGGVFDVPAGRAVTIPIDARLSVRRPTLFVVTLEATGGVVVSGRDRVVVLAKVE